jgi:hypothetical protein
VHNLNYTPTTLGVQVENILHLGVREKEKVEYHWSKAYLWPFREIVVPVPIVDLFLLQFFLLLST